MVCQAQDFEGVLVADVGVEVAFEHFSVSLIEVYPSSSELYHLRWSLGLSRFGEVDACVCQAVVIEYCEGIWRLRAFQRRGIVV